MNVEIKIDSEYREPKIVIFTDRMTDEISELVRRLSNEPSRVVSGFKDGELSVPEQSEILRVYAESGKVIAAASDGEYVLRLRLYEAEERLDRSMFVRISKSEIINLKRVKGFDLSLAGTIRVTFADGTSSYVSRRYLTKIKQILGL